MNSMIIIIAVILSIVIGRMKKINIGLPAMAFAYLIGSFLLNMKPGAIIALWPMGIFFVILAISLFFNFANENGTLETLASNLLYRFRAYPAMLPVVIFFVAALIAALGAGYYAVMVILTPIALIICNKINVNPLIGGLAVDLGGQVGSNFMISLNGVIFRNLITGEGYSSEIAFTTTLTIFIIYLIMAFVIITGMMFFSRKQTLSGAGQSINLSEELKKAVPFNQKQKINLSLIFIFVAILLIPSFLHFMFPGAKMLTFINSKIDVGLIAIIFAIIALFLGLGDDKSVISRVPWNTLIMISGMGMLTAVAVKAGTIQLLAHWVSTSIPIGLIPVTLSIVAAFVNIIGGSFVGVVAPALFPVVASVAHLTGLNPTLLYTCLTVGGLATGISPFSAGGAIIMGFTKESERDVMFRRELFIGLPVSIACAVVASLIYFAIVG
ncbi:dicarboxylate carrier protein matc n-terminus [Lucifera butyrica]|uniref:Dicarboxylate carrier protein matc n-terminus n=1 Tax=Lucifera butyrica TaxID=1351585 RepID=A0A498REV3_9FIRM|nr:SLC13 family permease [Lucifera butyrica]VBB09340.1 dicarboxylate carrier protein matc n-terminus [Lucifera butyrica]